MNNRKITIKDIAEELGLSTATISNVIHGKTHKMSERTIKKVQEKLESSGYIPNMAAVLLAQNSSKIVCVMLFNDEKYENKMIEDPFIAGMLNGLSKELSKKGYFMMLKEETKISNIARYASMWNMAGLILIGYCEIDYEALRNHMHIPFVVIDSYTKVSGDYSDVGIDNIYGGYLAGAFLVQNGHKKMMYLSDNREGCDWDRYIGLNKALNEKGFTIDYNDFKELSKDKTKRYHIYEQIKNQIGNYTAAFCASDVYAIEFMGYLQSFGLKIPDDFSIIGFDDIPLAKYSHPPLCTIAQNLYKRSEIAVELLQELIQGNKSGRTVLLPVTLIKRESVKNIT